MKQNSIAIPADVTDWAFRQNWLLLNDYELSHLQNKVFGSLGRYQVFVTPSGNIVNITYEDGKCKDIYEGRRSQ
jgi:hypothetical protein